MTSTWIRSCTVIVAIIAGAHHVVSADEIRVDSPNSLQQALTAAAPGDVILLGDGIWRDVDLLVDATGRAEQPITVRAEAAGKLTITGQSRLRIAGSHVVVEGLRFENAWHKTAVVEFRKDSKRLASHCRLTDCELINCNPPDSKLESKYVSIYGHHNLVDHCRLVGKTNAGTTLVVWLGDDTGNHQIVRNHFGPRPVLGRNGGETIRIGDSDTAHLSAKTLVAENLFEECNGETEIVSNKSCDNIYRGNVFRRCSGTLTLRHGHGCLVERNFFLGEKASGSGGVRIIGRDHVVVNNYFERLEGDKYRSAVCVMNGIADSPANGYEPVQRVIVAHNTFVDCKRTILIGGDNEAKSQVPPEKCLFANNVIVARRGPMVDLKSDSESIRWEANRCFGDGELGIEESSGWRRLTELPLRELDSRWTLWGGSPLINAGLSSDFISKFDISGKPRDAMPDIGCDEWPIDAQEIFARIKAGPSWSP